MGMQGHAADDYDMIDATDVQALLSTRVSYGIAHAEQAINGALEFVFALNFGAKNGSNLLEAVAQNVIGKG